MLGAALKVLGTTLVLLCFSPYILVTSPELLMWYFFLPSKVALDPYRVFMKQVFMNPLTRVYYFFNLPLSHFLQLVSFALLEYL